ncbi:hypothetical protein CQA53_09180 [Helicobacter didelphidarum]|uniref:Prokaryotic metallothionein family protein n=1 Tax=Helicobacter didelphidarum TaxID=2040648 RepID=A0A3D8IBV0_9HELI|nr:hypothetical protein [Helicobacter didelphidarum]RDU62600.1 hypothetical protein CQA53_09180 [Helicobacter didelphidarum]
MIYIYILLLVGIAFLILERKRFFGQKSYDSHANNNHEMNLIQCSECGLYFPQENATFRQGKDYCQDCIKKIR